MSSWQYAWLTDQPYTTIGFSHPQPGLAADLAGVLGTGLLAPQSNEWSISLDRSRVNLGYVSGLLGDRGWEMFAVETRLQPNAITPAQLQTNWYFKKQGPDRPAGATMSTTAAAAPATYDATPSMASAAPMAAAPMAAAPMVDAAPPMVDAAPPMATAPMVDAAPPMATAPMVDASPAATSTYDSTAPMAAAPMASSPEMAPQAAPIAPMPTAPTAPPGPEAASMSGVATPPPGPDAAPMPPTSGSTAS